MPNLMKRELRTVVWIALVVVIVVAFMAASGGVEPFLEGWEEGSAQTAESEGGLGESWRGLKEASGGSGGVLLVLALIAAPPAGFLIWLRRRGDGGSSREG